MRRIVRRTILNYALRFGRQEWDVMAVPASLTGPLIGEDYRYNEWARSLIRAQDFEVADAEPWRNESTKARLSRWINDQRRQSR